MKTDWRSFTLRVAIGASPKAVFEAWTSQQGLESWFLRMAQFKKPDQAPRPRTEMIREGDEYVWLWHGYSDEVVEKHSVLSNNGWDRLQFKFAENCRVTVEVKQEAGAVVCELTQEMLMDDEGKRQYYFIECGKGWTFYLANLKSVLEGGIDLRNRNPELQKLIS